MRVSAVHRQEERRRQSPGQQNGTATRGVRQERHQPVSAWVCVGYAFWLGRYYRLFFDFIHLNKLLVAACTPQLLTVPCHAFSAYFEEKTTQPHLINLDEDTFRSKRYLYMLTRQTTWFVNVISRKYWFLACRCHHSVSYSCFSPPKVNKSMLVGRSTLLGRKYGMNTLTQPVNIVLRRSKRRNRHAHMCAHVHPGKHIHVR